MNLESLRGGIIGGSTVPGDLLKQMKEQLKLKSIIVGYGKI